MASYKDVVTPTVTVTVETYLGRVKWFNNKAGYGFITITDGDRKDTDIFVHHSSIQVENQQYKYLIQGEYVEFELSATSSGAHEVQATNVAGVKGGKLMCETRHEFKLARTNYKSDKSNYSSNTPSSSTVDAQHLTADVLTPPVLQRSKTIVLTDELNATTNVSTKSKPKSRGQGPREAGTQEWSTIKKREPRQPKQKVVKSGVDSLSSSV